MALLRPAAVALALLSASAHPAVPPAPGSLQVLGATRAQTRAVHDVAAGFRRARLGLPTVVVTFHATPTPCNGALGLASTGRGAARVDICLEATVTSPQLRHAIGHELAHAHLDRYTDPARRARFLQQRGLRAWYDTRDPWDERGAEQAAEVVAWATARPPLLLIALPHKDCDSLAAAYIALLQRVPPDAQRCPIS